MASGTIRSRLLNVLVVIFACPGAYYLGTFAAVRFSPPIASPPLPAVNGLSIAPAELDLGEVWETPDHTATIRIRNTTSETRTIAAFTAACDCVGVEPQSLTILPGQTAEVTVRLDPVFKGDYAPTPGWELRAHVRSRVTLDTDRLAFADQCMHGGLAVARRVRATVHGPGHRMAAVAVPDVAAVDIEPAGPG